MSTTESYKTEPVHVITYVQRRRRYAAHEKHAIMLKTLEAGQSVSAVAHEHALAPSQLYQWRKAMEEGARVGVSTDDGVVAKAEFKKLQERTRRLERLLGMKTEEVEGLKEAVRIGREKNSYREHPCPESRVSNDRHCKFSGDIASKLVRNSRKASGRKQRSISGVESR